MTTRGKRPTLEKTNSPVEGDKIIKIVTSRANKDGTKSYQIKWKNRPMSWLKSDRIPREFIEDYNQRTNRAD